MSKLNKNKLILKLTRKKIIKKNIWFSKLNMEKTKTKL
jgi:hypothetical protein